MTYKNILITGANSGIGKALALYYAKEKRHLFLTGCDKTRLNDIKKQCKNLGATVTTKTIDKPHFYMVYCSIFEATNRVLSSDFRGNRGTYAEGSWKSTKKLRRPVVY